jgi:hypothetical protein
VSTEVASTRLPREVLRELDREASARGISRSVYLGEVIEGRGRRDAGAGNTLDVEALTSALAGQLRELREGQRHLSQGLRDIQTALRSRERATPSDAGSPLIERLVFSTFFSEALMKRVSALLYRHPGELAQVTREARDQAEAEAKRWRERMEGEAREQGTA